MKFIHLSDLHLGKRVNEFSMIEDQEFILKQILGIIDDEQPEAVLIAGDVYDKPVPSAEAVALFDTFLVGLSKRRIKVFVISGNHDSAERIAFGSRIMNSAGINMSPVYDGEIEPVTLTDDYGKLNVYMLPFIKPSNVRVHFPEAEISSYTEAVKTAIDQMSVNPSERNILITHQFVTGASSAGSEEMSVGGTDNVDVSVFDGFDYVALGHIHRSQKCGSENVRYSGTPLKYSFSEANDHKSVTIAELREKDNLKLKFVPLQPKHDMAEIRGTYNELMLKSFYEHTTYRTDYLHITLTDEEDVPDALARMRQVYTNIMKLDYDNTRTRNNSVLQELEDIRSKSPAELFSEFYKSQNGLELSPEQAKLIDSLVAEIWEEGK